MVKGERTLMDGQGRTKMADRKSWTTWGEKKIPFQGVVKRDWVPTGRIDFATRLNGDGTDADHPSEFKLLVEERRIVESIAGNENLEIQWRLATLSEAKAVVTQYHKYLSENSLIKSIPELFALPAPTTTHGSPSSLPHSVSSPPPMTTQETTAADPADRRHVD
jgi:hypothetical protein